jgi:hypothetical protein
MDDPALPGDPVVNGQNLQLIVNDVNRNAALDTVPPAENTEIIIVTVELTNLGDEDFRLNEERDFRLVNSAEDEYAPTVGAIDGGLERDGSLLKASEGIQGRLVFEVPSDGTDWVLVWTPGRDSESRYLYLE